MIEKLAKQLHYTACAFGGNIPIVEAECKFPWEELDERRKEGMRAIAQKAIQFMENNK